MSIRETVLTQLAAIVEEHSVFPFPDDVTDNVTDQTSNTGLLKLSAIYKKDFNNQLNYDVIGRFSNEYRTDNISSQVVGNNIFEGM